MKDINKKELKAFIKSRAYEDLRKSQRKQVIVVQILSSIILLLLGATFWQIIILIISTELILEIVSRKVSKIKNDKYEQEYLDIMNKREKYGN
jgi:hypothetical protein